MRCSHPGLKGDIITLDATSWHVAVLEIEVFDCPNGFMHLNNKCVKWLADDTLVNHHKQCDLYRGKLLDASENTLLALSVMAIADKGEIFSGKQDKLDLHYLVIPRNCNKLKKILFMFMHNFLYFINLCKSYILTLFVSL